MFEGYESQHLISEDLLGSHTKLIKRCSNKLSFEVLVPKEIGKIGVNLCNTLKEKHTVKCNYLGFNKLLKNLSDGSFDAALISLTIDLPYVESVTEYLYPNSTFSIVNRKVNLPTNLFNSYGDQYWTNLNHFNNEQVLFIVLSSPKRFISGSKMEMYIPSLINPGYDYISNLIR